MHTYTAVMHEGNSTLCEKLHRGLFLAVIGFFRGSSIILIKYSAVISPTGMLYIMIIRNSSFMIMPIQFRWEVIKQRIICISTFLHYKIIIKKEKKSDLYTAPNSPNDSKSYPKSCVFFLLFLYVCI